MNRKGVCYDVGRVMMGSQWRPKFDLGQVRSELKIIQEDLHCNAVRICGLDIQRLVAASEEALALGLEVWLSPEMWDRSMDETLGYLAQAAAAAEDLRLRWPGKVVFSVGSELTLFMQGIVEGSNVFERMNNPAFWESIGSGRHNGPLNSFLGEAAVAVRRAFHGQVTYFSVPIEAVEWSRFDFVGVDHYRDTRTKETYGPRAAAFLRHGKPVVIGEFGCCTYDGAEKLGGNGFMVVFGMLADYLGPAFQLPEPMAQLVSVIPRADGHYVRDETLQASEVTDELRALDAARVEGAFVFTFVSPTSPYNEDPRFDGDMGSYSLVKSYPEEDTVGVIAEQTARQGKAMMGLDLGSEVFAKFAGEVGRRGETYPGLPWEPKESFRAVADYYAAH